jgi:heavy metal sensor kinase
VKLVNRVSLFFLAALAIVLVVTSGSFYVFVRAQLVRQFEQELVGTLNLLVAAVEVEPEDVSWQPLEHAIALGAMEGSGDVHWAVIGDGSRVIEKSSHAGPALMAEATAIASREFSGADTAPTDPNSAWRIRYRKLAARAPDAHDRDPDEYDEIIVVAARSAAPLNANLGRLLVLVCVLPVAVWLLAAAAGHWFCRRALRPVREMSEQARSMSGADFQSRMPVARTGDELSDLAAAFNTLLDSQHRAFEQQRRFAGDAAHELRTPLTVLLGQIDVALRRTRSPDEYAETLRLLRDETRQLETIVQSLLFLARADEDAILPHAETFSLAAWLPGYMTRWDDHPRRGDISLEVGPGGRGHVKASQALLARLLDNLIENALKYSAAGTRVEVIMTNDAAGVCVEVRDHGDGIAPEDQARIFQPFFRSYAARDAGIAGTGLGLAIAARIATACGGSLHCASETGQGSRFTLRLPAVVGAAPVLEPICPT